MNELSGLDGVHRETTCFLSYSPSTRKPTCIASFPRPGLFSSGQLSVISRNGYWRNRRQTNRQTVHWGRRPQSRGGDRRETRENKSANGIVSETDKPLKEHGATVETEFVDAKAGGAQGSLL